MTALGPSAYFSDGWCRFDFFLVCTAFLDEFITLDEHVPLPPYLLRVLRVVRLLRILRLLKGAKELRNLIVTMILSFPALLNVGGMLCLVTFIYGVLGMNLFTWLVHADSIDEQRNFETLSSSMLLLFQCLTGDNWSGMMTDALVSEESGRCTQEEGNCGTGAAIPYFVSFQLLGSFVFLNLVVAVILETFAALGSENPDFVASGDLDGFREAWAEFDPDATGYIPSKHLIKLIMSTPAPLGIGRLFGKREKDAIKLALALGLRHYSGRVAFPEVLDALVRHATFRNQETIEKNEHLYAVGVAEDPITEHGFNLLVPQATKFRPELLPLPVADEVVKLQTPGHIFNSQAEWFEAELASKVELDVPHIIALQILSKHAKRMHGWKVRAKTSGMRARLSSKAASALRPGIPKATPSKKPRDSAQSPSKVSSPTAKEALDAARAQGTPRSASSSSTAWVAGASPPANGNGHNLGSQQRCGAPPQAQAQTVTPRSRSPRSGSPRAAGSPGPGGRKQSPVSSKSLRLKISPRR